MPHKWGCSQVKVLQQLEQNHHRHVERSPTDAQLINPIFKEFLGLLPASHYHSHLLIFIQPLRSSINDMKPRNLCNDKFSLYAGCSSTSHCMTSGWSWTPWATWWQALSCSRVITLMSLLWLFLILVHRFEVVNSDRWHWLCHYVLWHPKVWVGWCSSGPVWADLPHGTPSLNCAVSFMLLTQLTALSYISLCQHVY